LVHFLTGCRGHLTKQLMQKFNLNAESDNQTYGIGLKEVWEIQPEHHK
jgi:electron-transferring-flavoprotein dehydrogenase